MFKGYNTHFHCNTCYNNFIFYFNFIILPSSHGHVNRENNYFLVFVIKNDLKCESNLTCKQLHIFFPIDT